MMVNIMSVYTAVVVVAILGNSVLGQQYIGDRCTIQRNGASGTCKLLGDCSQAIQDIQHQIFPQTCGFQGTQPIVCCAGSNPVTQVVPPTPTTTTSTTRRPTPVTPRSTPTPTTKRTTTAGPPVVLRVGDKSQLKCTEYSKYAFETKNPNPLVIGGESFTRIECTHKIGTLIVGGEPAKPKEFPHMALIGFQDESEPTGKTWQCGGTLISERFILTAGHCLSSAQFGDAMYVRLGDLDLGITTEDSRPQELNVIDRIRHPNYRPPSQYNDIGLLKLQRAATFNLYVRPACLNTGPLTTATAIATGWGRTDFAGDVSAKLLKVTLEYYAETECNYTYRNNINRRLDHGIEEESQICAGSRTQKKDTCQGDSGGPLQIYSLSEYCMYDIVGVTSFGRACGAINSPGVYTRVSRYIEWLEGIVF